MRREVDYVVQDEGRDKGKIFHLKEAPANVVEWWAVRAYSALEKSGIDVGAVASHGARGLVYLGIKGLALIPPEQLRPLMDEMFQWCVQIKPDRNNPAIIRSIVELGGEGDDIEEVSTRFKLRQAIADLTLGFSLTAGQSTSAPAAQEAEEPKHSPSASSNTPTSQGPLARRFHPVKRHSETSTKT